MQHQPPSLRKSILWGIAIGVLAGVLEAMLAAWGEDHYWRRFQRYYLQLGAHGWLFGLIGGYLVGRDKQAKYLANTAGKYCVQCGYNLTGNASGICPECGTPTKP